MARIYEGDVRRGDMPKAAPSALVLVPSDNSRYHGWQGRTLEDVLANPPATVESMIDSLMREGQKQPIAAHPVAGNKLKVHAGFTRAVAAMLIVSRGLNPEFRIDVKVEDCNEKEAFRSSVVENHARNETTAVDDAHAIRTLEQYGYSEDDICVIYGTPDKPRSRSWLNDIRRILQLPDEIKNDIHTKQLAAWAAIRLAKIEDPKVRDKVLKECKEDANGKPVTEQQVLAKARKQDALAKPTFRRMPEIREFWKERSVPGANTPRVRRIADFMLRYHAGEIDAKAVDAELARI